MKFITQIFEGDDQTKSIISYKKFQKNALGTTFRQTKGKIYFVSVYLPYLFLIKIYLPKTFTYGWNVRLVPYWKL